MTTRNRGFRFRYPPDKAVNDPKFFRQRLWLGLSRWTWVRLAFLFIVLMSAYGFYRTQQVADTQQRQVVARCIDGNRLRGEVRALIEFAYSQAGGTIDLTTVPSFAQLDPPTQQYMRDLTAELSAPTPPESRQARIDAAEKNVHDVDCANL